MTRVCYTSTILILFAGIFSSCITGDDLPDPGQDTQEVPVITEIDPPRGLIGDEIIIFGENFSSSKSENEVEFNGAAAEILTAAPNNLVVLVPEDATTGRVRVTVNDQIVLSDSDFEVRFPPTITSFEPTEGPVETVVTITGTHFSSIAGDNEVKFNEGIAEVLSATETELRVVVPNTASIGKISIIVDELSVSSETDFTFIPHPLITSFSPLLGVAGEEITISGFFFSETASENLIKINGVEATVTSVNAPELEPMELKAIIPEGTGTGKVEVITNSLPDESDLEFTYLKDIPRDGLVAFYPFSENANDEGGNELNGTVHGAGLTTDRFGNENRAYSFDGVDDYIDMGNPTDLQISDKITVALWTKSSSFVNNRIMLHKTDKVDGYKFETGQIAAGPQGYTIFVYSSTDAGTNMGRLSNDYVADEWTFVAFTLDGATVQFYHDAVPATSITTHRKLTDGTTGNFQIGGGDNFFWYNGEIDDVTVYDRILTSEEINQLYEQTISKR